MNANILTLGSRAPSYKLAVCLLTALWVLAATASEFEALGKIRATAEQFALARVNDDKLSAIEAQANSMDPRLRLRKCEQPLQAFSNTNSRNVVRTTVGVRCNGIKPWTIYVPVTISALTEVVYTLRPLVRGEVLRVEDLEVKQLPLDQLPANYLSSIDELAGMELTRSLTSGAIFTLNSVKPRKLVQRGQEVVILATGSGIQVRMLGIALKNGAAGELIPVRNLSSGRTIEAEIINNGTVAVKM